MSDLLTTFRFEVSLVRASDVVAGAPELPGIDDPAPTLGPGASLLGQGAFQECSGLEIEVDVQEYAEGGRNNGVVRRLGRAKFQSLVLKRGMFYEGSDGKANTDLWRWMQQVINGERPVPRYNGVVKVMSADKTLRATWTFERGLPAKIKGPELNGKTGEIAVEELTIAHEGLRLVLPDGGDA